jgi:hypothetical protein
VVFEFFFNLANFFSLAKFLSVLSWSFLYLLYSFGGFVSVAQVITTFRCG